MAVRWNRSRRTTYRPIRLPDIQLTRNTTKKFDSILRTVGHTPLVKLNKLGPEGVNVWVKVEAFNPMGSVKDRMALAMIEAAEKSGALKPGQTIVEATSGNTGIGLAMVCAQKGYPLVITMAENFSLERRRLMRFLGAKVVLTSAAEKGSGMVRKARELAERHGWWQPRQFDNPVNAEVHARTTAREILADFAEEGLDYWVSGFGTGGTFSGVARTLRECSPDTRIVLCEPDNSQLVVSGVVEQRGADGAPLDSHPKFRPHPVQGWSPDFIPSLMEEAIRSRAFDRTVPVDGNRALQCARKLARREGILAGISAGATLAGALAVAEEAPPESNILCMLPDTGERYLSTVLFDDVEAKMNTEELAILESVATLRSVEAPAAREPEVPSAQPEAVAEMGELIRDNSQPVVVFGLEWCEFCWSVKQALDGVGVTYRSVDLDSAEYRRDDKGAALRVALRQRTGWNTFPQVFVAAEFIGGCTDLFDGMVAGSFFERLAGHGISCGIAQGVDPYALVPGWLPKPTAGKA